MMSDFQDPDYDRRSLAHTALTQARDAMTHFDDPEVAQAAFAAHAPGLVQAGWAPDLVDAVHRRIGQPDAGSFVHGLLGAMTAPRPDPARDASVVPLDETGLQSYQPAPRVERAEPMRVDDTFVPADARSAQMWKQLTSGISHLAEDYMARNATFLARNKDGTLTSSRPSEEFAKALSDLSWTELGGQGFRYAQDRGMKQVFVYDPAAKAPAVFDKASGEIVYNPAMVERHRLGTDGALEVPGDEHETATLPVVLGHEWLGHGPVGRGVLGLPEIPMSPPAPLDELGRPVVYLRSPAKSQEELRAVRAFENPIRSSFGLPLRRSVFREGDVYPQGGPN